MLVADLVAQIRADGIAAYQAGMQQAAGATDQFASKSTAALDRVKAGMSTIGGVQNTVAAATLGIGTAVFATGASYNKLQQNAGVALQTLLGGAEAANAQMAKLNDFTSRSPFGKDTFIRGQQQLLAFGIEASNVIPYLDGIQNAVAAIGKGDTELSGIVDVIAKVRSSATLSQQDLTELANRGINAAELIGIGMDKSEAEVRESIFGNPLRGEEALAGLDALMEGMTTKFAGTTDKLKEQMTGAQDRIKAATRDIGASLAAPFIDPEGGGKAVEWANQYADVLRAVQRQTGPVVDMLMVKAAPAIEALESSLFRAKLSADGFSLNNLERDLSKIVDYGPAVAGALTALSVAGGNPLLAKLGISTLPGIALGLGAAAAASPEMRAAVGDLLTELEPLLDVGGEVALVLAGTFTEGVKLAAGAVDALLPLVRLGVGVLEQVPTPVLAAATAFGILKVASGGSMWTSLVNGTQRASDGVKRLHGTVAASGAWTAFQAGAGGSAVAAAGLTGASNVAGGAVTRLGLAMKSAFLSNPVGVILTVAATALGAFAMANADAAAKVSEHKAQVAQFRNEINLANGQLTESGLTQLYSNLVEDGTTEKLKDAGVAMKDYVAGVGDITGANKAAEEQLIRNQIGLVSTTREYGTATKTAESLGVSLETLTAAAHGSSEAQNEVNARMKETGYEAKYLQTAYANLREQGVNTELLEHYYEQQDVIRGASEAAKAYAIDMQNIRAAGGDAAVAQRQLESALGVVRDTAASAEERLAALKSTLDILNGGTQSAADQAIAIQHSINAITDAFAEGENGAAGFSSGLINAAGEIDLTNEAGLRLAETLRQQGDAAQLAAISAQTLAKESGKSVEAQQQAAVAAMQPYLDALYEQVEAGKITQEQADALRDTYYGFPPEVAIAVTDNGTTDMQQLKVDALLLALQSAEMGAEIPVDADTLAAAEKLTGVDFQTKTLSNGTIVVVADTSSAEASLWAIQNTRRTVYVDVVTVNSTSYSTSPYSNAGQSMEANGGMWAQGMKAFAAGGMNFPIPGGMVPSGMYRGGANIVKFAEPETRWEAYISGKAGMEMRNREVLRMAGERLGMVVLPASALQTRHYADGGMSGRATSSAVAAAIDSGRPIQVTYAPVYQSMRDATAAEIQRSSQTDLVRTIRGAIQP